MWRFFQLAMVNHVTCVQLTRLFIYPCTSVTLGQNSLRQLLTHFLKFARPRKFSLVSVSFSSNAEFWNPAFWNRPQKQDPDKDDKNGIKTIFLPEVKFCLLNPEQGATTKESDDYIRTKDVPATQKASDTFFPQCSGYNPNCSAKFHYAAQSCT